MNQEAAAERWRAIKRRSRGATQAALAEYGGLNPALQRSRVLNATCAGSRRSAARDHDGTEVALNANAVRRCRT